MAWETNRNSKLYSLPYVTTFAGHDVWRDVITIPASELQAGHKYALIATGVIGDMVPHFPAAVSTLEVALRIDGVNYDELLVMDMKYPSLQRSELPPRGFPLHNIRVFDAISGQAVELKVRLTSPGGTPSCLFDSPALLLFDLTKIGAANWHHASSTTPATLPTYPQAASKLVSLGSITDQTDHFVSFACEVESRGGVGYISAAWMNRTGTHTTTANDRLWSSHSGTLQADTYVGVRHRANTPSVLANPLQHRLCFGSQQVTNVLANGGSYPWSDLSVFASDVEDTPNNNHPTHNVISRTEAIAIRIDPFIDEKQLEKVPGATNQATRLFGYNEQWKAREFDSEATVVPHEAVMIHSARAKQSARGPAGELWHARTIQDINGIKMSPRDGNIPVAVQLATRNECLETTRMSKFVLLPGEH